jgi:predicted dehydrogenase
VDINLSATLHYADGRRAHQSCAMDAASQRHATIVGTGGTIETEYLNHTSDRPGGHPWGCLPSQLRLRRGTANSIPFETVEGSTASGFRFAAEAFARVIAAGNPAAIGRAAQAMLDNAATLDALARSAKLGQAVDVARC